jgi:hypothetical protein
MKNLFWALCVVAGVSFLSWNNPAYAEEAAVKTKEVCKDVTGKDGKPVKNKDGSTKQTCKTIKVHKKHEGTAVPEGKKK